MLCRFPPKSKPIFSAFGRPGVSVLIQRNLCVLVQTLQSLSLSSSHARVFRVSFLSMESETLEEKKPEEGEEAEEMAEEGGEKEEIQEEEEKGDEENKGKGGKKAGGGRKRGRKKKGEGSKKAEEGEEKKTKKERQSKAGEEPATPIERPVRERKKVERYSASSEKASASKVFSIKKGRGMQLKDIPNVAYKLSKRKVDDNLQMLHAILFGKKSNKYNTKRNIYQFSGFVWAENEEKQRAKVKEKIDKCVKERLFDFCEILDIPVSKASIKKEELSAKLLDFLESPHATTDVLLAEEQSQKGRKRKRTTERSQDTSVAESSVKKRKKNHEVSKVKMGLKNFSKAEEKVESEDDDEPTGSVGASEEDDAVPDESDHAEGQSEEEEENQKEHVESKKRSAKKQVKGSETKTEGKATAVKKSPTSKSLKNRSKSSLKKEVSSDEGDDDDTQEEERDHPKSESGEEEDEQKEYVESKRVSSKKPVKGSAAMKGKGTPVKKEYAAKSVIGSSKSVTKKGDNVSSSRSTSKSKGKGLPSKKEVKKKSKESQSSSAKEKKTSKKQAKSGAKISAKERTGKGKVTVKARAEPSREEMLAAVTGILKEVDFNTATLSDILMQLGNHFETDLMHKKAEVKSIIEEVINNMTDDEEETEDDTEHDAEEADENGDE